MSAMEWLKFAFDTLVIGALALPWLWLLVRIFLYQDNTYIREIQEVRSGGDILSDSRIERSEIRFPFIEILPTGVKEAASGALVIAIGYFLGCAVSRISSDFFDDTEIMGKMPSESSIRTAVYLHEYCDVHSVLRALPLPTEELTDNKAEAVFCGIENGGDSETQSSLIDEFFRLQESAFLLEGQDKIQRLRELHDQIEILRGATLNFGLLSTLSLFGWCVLYRAKLRILQYPPRSGSASMRTVLKLCTYIPALTILLLGFLELGLHLKRATSHIEKPAARATISASDQVTENGTRQRTITLKIPPNNTHERFTSTINPFELHDDPPLAEAVLILLGLAGLFLRLSNDSLRLFGSMCVLSAVLMLIAYGSWWWTENLYDQQVIHTFPARVELKRS